jgi:hypothetical protein
MTLEDEISQAQVFITEPPKNESNTCEWIILPILWSTGYARRDIESRMADSTGQYPDYTLLPNHATATYYLEAKAWNVTLEDMHVKQALNYANHNGRRFVVLTNGQNWRLYDNAIQGQLAVKLLTEVRLRDTAEITDFLTALSKQKILEGSLERMAEEARQRKLQEAHDLQVQKQREVELQIKRKRMLEMKGLLDTMLPAFLKDPKTDLVISMAISLSDKEGLQYISPEAVSEWFDEKLHGPSPKMNEQDMSSSQSQTTHAVEQQGRSVFTLKEMQGMPIDGKKGRPFELQTPDGTQVAVRSWVNLAEHIVSWLLQQTSPLPLPFESSHHTRWFLNCVPEHKRPDQRTKFKKISFDGQTVYMDRDRSGRMFLDDLYALCRAMHIATEAFHITVI